MTQQILLYNQQYVYDDANNNSVLSVTVTYAVTMKTSADAAQYDYYYCATAVSIVSPSTVTVGDTDGTVHFAAIDAESSAIHDEMPFAVKNGIPAAAIADGAQYDYYYGDTAVSIASPSIVTVTLKTYDTGGANDEANTVTTKMTTSHTSPSSDTVSDTESSSSAIYGEDSPSAGNDSPTAVKMMTNDMNNTVYFAVIDTESSATCADEAPYDYYYGDTPVSIASPFIAID